MKRCPVTEEISHYIIADQVEKILNQLTTRERRILEMRHGFFGGTSYTLREVGKILGLSYERVRQIEISIYAKIRWIEKRQEKFPPLINLKGS
jgi:RNA polymerase sigma factor (sigma-70 family)